MSFADRETANVGLGKIPRRPFLRSGGELRSRCAPRQASALKGKMLCMPHAMPRVLRRVSLVLALFCGVAARGQENPAPAQQPPVPAAPIPEETVRNPNAPCVQPTPGVSWEDYEGPLAKAVAIFAQRLERKSVHAPHYKPGAILCSLTLGGKFRLFAEDTIDPVTFLSVGFNAGIDQAENNEPRFGQGAQGYGKRFGYGLAGQATSEFFKDVTYSTIFSEDPRYYRLAHGSGKRRFFHAIEHVVVAKRENGKDEFNFCEWLGTASSVAVAASFHTGAEPGVGPAAGRVGFAIAQDAGWNVLREFWPEVAHKFKLPFRDPDVPQAAAPRSSATP